MLSTTLLGDLQNKINLTGFTYTIETRDEGGDFIQVFYPDLNFKLVKINILKNVPLAQKIIDVGPDCVILAMKDVWEGFNFCYTMKIYSGKAYGTHIFMGTKRVDYVDDIGNLKPFIGFEMMKEYVKAQGTQNI